MVYCYLTKHEIFHSLSPGLNDMGVPGVAAQYTELWQFCWANPAATTWLSWASNHPATKAPVRTQIEQHMPQVMASCWLATSKYLFVRNNADSR